jgi:integrase
MPREKLTLERIRRFSCPAEVKQIFLWDADSPLAIRATAGSKSFIYQGKLASRTVRVTIGDWQTWNLDDARAEARRLQTLVDQKIDPRHEKIERLAQVEAKRRHAERTEAPATKAWNAYLTARRPRWGERTYQDHLTASKTGGKARTRGKRDTDPVTTLPGALVPLLTLPLCQIDTDRVREWLKDEAARRPTQAALCFRLLRAFINWCCDHPEYRDQAHPDAVAARLARDELPKRSAKDDCLKREQLAPWFREVRKLPPIVATYLQVLLLTGGRREEIAALQWKDVDFQWKSLTIRDKVEGARTIPLTPFVAALLRELKARNEARPTKPRKLRADAEPPAPWKPSPWVFSSSTAKRGRLVEPRLAHNKALAAAGLPALTLHGLRRTFGTLAEWIECPVGISAQIMGHKPSALAEKHYRQRPIDLLRMWHTRIEAWILNEAGIEQPAAEGAPRLEPVPGKAAA